MTLQHMFFALSGGGAVGDIVTVSGGDLGTADKIGSQARMDFICDQNGLTYKRVNNGTPVQFNGGADWVRPSASAPGSYECMADNFAGDTGFGGVTGGSGVWHSMSASDFFVWVYDDTTGPGSHTITFDFHIRLDGGATLDSGSYTITANRFDE